MKRCADISRLDVEFYVGALMTDDYDSMDASDKDYLLRIHRHLSSCEYHSGALTHLATILIDDHENFSAEDFSRLDRNRKVLDTYII